MIAQLELVQLAPASPPLEALLAPNGSKGAGIRSLCRFLNIAHQMQIKRIRRQPDFAAALHVVTISTATGPKEALMLEGHAIAIWAAGLQTSRFSPDKQERVIILKRDAYAAIERAFEQSGRIESTANSAPPHSPNPMQTPAATLSPFDKIIDAVGELKEDYEAVQQRLALLERVTLGSREIHGASLSAEQVGQVILQLRLVRERSGIPIEEAEGRLARQFGVAHLSDIDASEWPALQQAIHALIESLIFL
jgi:hypothetical protein